jgi:diguanylate cyclase (GGDEF)-like protein
MAVRLPDLRHRLRVPAFSRLTAATTFAILALVGGGLLSQRIVGHGSNARMLATAEQYGTLVTRLGVRPWVGAHPSKLTPRAVHGLDRLWPDSKNARSDTLLALRVVTPTGRTLYRHGSLVMPDGPAERLFDRVVATHMATASLGAGGSRIDVAVPLSARRSAVALVSVPAAPFRADAHALGTPVSAGVIMICALSAVVLLINSAASRLRRQAAALRDHARQRAYMSEHDALTGLPNRTRLRDAAHELLVHQRGMVALLMIDLDEFKEINDTLGHSAGDELLRNVAHRLRDLPIGGTVARIGGDEFAVLTAKAASPHEAAAIATRIVEAISHPFHLEGLAVEVRPSVGIAVRPDHASDFATLMRFADIAMYHAKRRRTGVELYQPGQGTDRRLVGLGGDLRRAIDERQLTLRYQPQASLRSGSITSFEALVRWEHPSRGLISPDHFIPLAERSGLIRELTHAVLDQVCAQLREWLDRGVVVPIAVNLSTRDVIDTQLLEQLDGLLALHGVSAPLVKLEITESVLMSDAARAEAIVARLKQLGHSVAIDDFGTGYSSLGYLRKLPVDDLKIDQTFVRELDATRPDEVIVRSTIDLAHNLGLTVTAEGIESRSTWQKLRSLGCDYGQGYLISKPLSAAEATSLLRESRVDAA